MTILVIVILKLLHDGRVQLSCLIECVYVCEHGLFSESFKMVCVQVFHLEIYCLDYVGYVGLGIILREHP